MKKQAVAIDDIVAYMYDVRNKAFNAEDGEWYVT